MEAINIISLTKKYKNTSTLAVNNIDLQISEGEIFGLLGPNGAGKTTTISILCSLMSPTSGTIKILDFDIDTNLNKIRKLIGVVPQDIALYPMLSAKENLLFFGRMYGMRGATLSDRICELMEIFGLTEKAESAISTFSGGMKRRVNLMAGILHKPKILFLDEPTVGIDVQSKTVILDYLTTLNAGGMTIVYTSHHMEEAQKFCNKVAIIDMGEIIEHGNPTEIIKRHNGCNNLEDVFLKITGRRLRD